MRIITKKHTEIHKIIECRCGSHLTTGSITDHFPKKGPAIRTVSFRCWFCKRDFTYRGQPGKPRSLRILSEVRFS